MKFKSKALLTAGFMTIAGLGATAAQAVDLTMYYPVAVGGPVTKIIDDMVQGFQKENPDIKVEAVYAGNYTDTMTKAMTAMKGGQPPQLSVLFSTDLFTLMDEQAIVPIDELAGADGKEWLNSFYPAFMENGQVGGKTWSVPFQRSTIVLYYNKDAFKEAGITRPPRTLSEFDADAVKLTKPDGDSFSQLGFMPNFHGYESTTTHLVAQWSPTYFDADGKSTVDSDPAFPAMFTWQKHLVDTLGGYDKLEKHRSTFGDELGSKNPFMTGQVAMAIDGEWRAGMVDDAGVQFDYGVAPFPVPDGQVDTYGKGYLSGTIIGIASTSKKQNAAWELVKYLTTDTRAVVSFANAIHNIPSTNKALESSDLDRSQAVDAFIKIAQNPNSTTTPASPNGGAYQLTLQDVGYAYESGKETDLQGSLDRAAKQIDTDIDRAR